ncbi:MAG: preprotein translocase subunit SecY [Bacilli bacterium]|nr:preprotein translocase subunit SecY [Bacilli bacterium]
MFAMFKRIFAPRNKELKKRILFTLGALAVFAVGTSIRIPGTTSISNDLGFLELLNSMGGGALKRGSIFGLGVMPYISASIIIQLFSMNIIPYFTDLAKEGYTGRRKLNTITRYLGIAIAFIQGLILALGIVGKNANAFEYVRVSIILTAGTAFLLWIGDQITQKGVGNGLSLIIMAGIVAGLPYMFTEAFKTFVLGNDNLFIGIVSFTIYVLIYIAIVVGVVFIQESERRIPIQYSNKTASSYGAKQTYIPFKVNAASVMPVIFASTIIAIPQTLANFITNEGYIKFVNNYLNYNTVIGLIIYLLLIVLFSYIYTLLQFRPDDIAENLQKNGGYIPGIRPGVETKKYIKSVLIKITTFGTLFLVVIAALPIVFSNYSNVENANITLGGTGILIVVGVALETYKQIESVLSQKEYRGRF